MWSRIAFTAGLSLFASYSITHAQDARSLFSAGSGAKFETFSKNTQNTTSPSRDVKAANKSTEQKYSGLSYSIYQELSNEKIEKVSPKKVFRTGDRIRIDVTSNKSGELLVVNINPEGKSSVVSEQSVVAGKVVNVPSKGFLKFVGERGVENLFFVLSEKNPTQKTLSSTRIETIVIACLNVKADTRSLVVDDSAGNEFKVINSNGTCATDRSGTATRSLVVDVADNTGYGVIPSSRLGEGQILTLRIKLRHE